PECPSPADDESVPSAAATAPIPRVRHAESARSASTAPLRPVASEPLPSRASSSLPGESPFTPWISGYLGNRYVLDRLPAPAAADQVRRALHAAIRAEGPVHLDRLAKLV